MLSLTFYIGFCFGGRSSSKCEDEHQKHPVADRCECGARVHADAVRLLCALKVWHLPLKGDACRQAGNHQRGADLLPDALQVSGPSMFPTFTGQGDIVVVDAVSTWTGSIQTGTSPCVHALCACMHCPCEPWNSHLSDSQDLPVASAGDVVICSRPVDPTENIIKRVTAVADEFVVVYPDREHAGIRRVQVSMLPPHQVHGSKTRERCMLCCCLCMG